MKKVVIIGAGIAGLTCGIYLKLNGFDTDYTRRRVYRLG